MPVPDREEASQHLAVQWEAVTAGQIGEEDIAGVEQSIRNDIARLMSSDSVTFRYCLPTQLLGKLTEPDLDSLCLQRGALGAQDSTWDPRSFCARVIVPWVQDNEDVLGKSTDPYVSNPLRQPRILPSPSNVRPNTLPLWQALHGVLFDVEEHNDPHYTLAAFHAVLLAVHENLLRQRFDYPVLPRVSLAETMALVEALLSDSREGEHAMSLAAALFVVVGRRFRLWDEVVRVSSTTSDRATGMVGDIECRKDGELTLAAEIKERQVTVGDVRAFEAKLNPSGLTEALIGATGERPADAGEVGDRIRQLWTRGINLYVHSINGLTSVTMSLAGEAGRQEFIAEVGRQLDAYARPRSRAVWRDLLLGTLEGGSS